MHPSHRQLDPISTNIVGVKVGFTHLYASLRVKSGS